MSPRIFLKKEDFVKKHWIFVITFFMILPCIPVFAGYIEDTIDVISKAEYVGSERCLGCHEQIYFSWLSTLHPYKVRPATENTVVGDFVKNNKLTIKDIKDVPDKTEYTTTMSKKDGKFFITTIGSGGKEETYPVKYVLGGVWKQRYMTEFKNGAIMILPVQWNIATRQWVDYQGFKTGAPGSGKYWADKNRTWQYQCGSCHSTGVKVNYNASSDTFRTTWVDNGISCEACHGPGSIHSAEPKYKKTATIINPAKIPDARRAAQTCGQCHNRGTSTAETKVATGPKFYEYPNGDAGYLPGKVLDNYYVEKPGLWPDGSSKQHHQQYNDWAKSKHADAGVNCWDCHKVHGKGVISKHSLREAGDKLCLNCHSVSNTLMHGIHGANSCTECHMPKTATNAVKTGPSRYDIANHTFRVVSPAESIRYGGIDKQPNSCNACHYHAKDKPEDLLKAIDAVRNKTRESLGLEKKVTSTAVEKK